MTFDDLLELAGGSTTKLAAVLDLHAVTVDGWRTSGVPKKYRNRLKELYGITDKDFEKINASCK